ncbi:unnamed protein product [Mycena citricolor]|uniref:Apurinic-apyrimidinic endonuclease 1 n=1 Tax=Mycena citricolor TaxID=2018698 RepID=A0AAD2HPV8_9AGAR|nr:unnamed protein product [Mycena citricolor]
MPAKRKLSTVAIESSSAVEIESSPRKKARAVRVSKTKSVSVAIRDKVDSPWKVGAHVSAAGGLENAVKNAVQIGALSFALFVKSQRKWTSPALTASTILAFKTAMLEHGYDAKHVLPHGSYLINLGNPDADKRKKSFDCFLDDLQRCESLGLQLYNFHPGSTVGEATTEESISLIAGCINDAHRATQSIVTVLENMAGAGNIIGGDFRHLAEIIRQVENKSRVGVCLDTCHMFAAGYDLRSKEGWDKIVRDFDEQVGLPYVRGMHLNDSKTALHSKKDRHENIGLGHIGLEGFRYILNDTRFQDIPLILETPSAEDPAVWATEITTLHSLSGSSGEIAELEPLIDALKEVVKSAGSKGKKTAGGKKATSAKKGRGKPAGDSPDSADGVDGDD